ncbi:hypothetical protein ACU8MB_08870 [Rhizobium leguminosarum]
MTEARHFPVFDVRPDDAYIVGWHDHINSTGYPEEYDRVSTSRPYNMEGVVILSGEIEVSTVRRLDQSFVPCPLCSPNSPKFKIGRMAYFPQERTVLFIGHKCAKRHMGEEYVAADRRYRDEAKLRSVLATWADIQKVAPQLRALAEALMPLAVAVETAKAGFAKEADGFLGLMRSEFLAYGGRVTQTVDTGLRDQRGRKVYDTQQLGTLVGQEFLDTLQPATQLRRALRHLAKADVPLPEWNASEDDEARLEEILRRGKELIHAVKQVKVIRDYVANARLFLHDNNLDLFETWGALDNSPFARLEFRRKGTWIFLDATSFQGADKASFRLSEDLFKPLPDINTGLFAIKGIGDA